MHHRVFFAVRGARHKWTASVVVVVVIYEKDLTDTKTTISDTMVIRVCDILSFFDSSSVERDDNIGGSLVLVLVLEAQEGGGMLNLLLSEMILVISDYCSFISACQSKI